MRRVEAMTKKINVGIPFDDNDLAEFDDSNRSVELVNAKTHAQESRTRNWLAIGVSLFAIVAIVATGAIGCFDGSYNETQAVWAVMGPFVGAVMYFYFGGKD